MKDAYKHDERKKQALANRHCIEFGRDGIEL